MGGADLKKSYCSCLRNPSGSDIRPVAVEMSDILEQCKEVVEEMTRKVVEFLEANMGQVGDNLEEGWGNLVEEYFRGDDVAALQVAVGTILLLITLPYWLYCCIAGNR